MAAAQSAASLTLVQTSTGQYYLQQAAVPKPTEPAAAGPLEIVINNGGNPAPTNFGGVQGIQVAGGIQLQSGVAASQPLLLQPGTANRNIIVQAAANAPANNVIQLGRTQQAQFQTVSQPVVLQPQSATNRNVVVQTVPVAGAAAANSPAASNVMQLSGQTQQRAEPAQSGLLVQIGGQMYRMQGVQQVQVANSAQTPNLRQIAPAASVGQLPAQPRPVNMATPIHPSAVYRQGNAATPSQPAVAARQPTVSTPKPATPSNSGVTQTITLTPSQLALLKQTPREKQMDMIQLFQRQQRAPTQPGVASPMKSVQIVGSSPLQRTPQSVRLSAPTIIRAGPPIAVRVGQSPSSSAATGNSQSVGMQVLRAKLDGEVTSTPPQPLQNSVISSHSSVMGEYC